MIERKLYMAGVVSHDVYYEQFITPSILEIVKDVDIDAPLKTWDLLPDLHLSIIKKLKEVGDLYSLGTKVCIYKCAKRKSEERKHRKQMSYQELRDEIARLEKAFKKASSKEEKHYFGTQLMVIEDNLDRIISGEGF